MALTIIRRQAAVAPTVVAVAPPTTENPPQVPKRAATGVPRGRGYLRTGVKETPRVHRENPHKTLEQILPRVYNTPIEEADLPYYRCETCKDTKRVLVFDECENCLGDGCKACNGSGEVRNYINCQSCNSIRVFR